MGGTLKSQSRETCQVILEVKRRANIFFRFDEAGWIMSLSLTCFIEFS
jgi:hypothetical protein